MKGLKSKVGALPEAVEKATLKAFSRLVDACLSERVDALVLAGDLFDQAERSVRARLFLAQQFERLRSQSIAVFAVAGNHDPLSAGAGHEWPSNVHLFGPTLEEKQLLGPNGEVRARIQGVSYPQERVTENLSRAFQRRGAEPFVAVLHANVGGVPGHAPYAPCSLEDLGAARADYWALGHVHQRAQFSLACGVAAYPGNLQARHIHEQGAKGALLVELDRNAPEGARAKTRFVPFDVVRWKTVTVDVSGAASVEALADVVESACVEGCERDVEWTVVRAQLVGSGAAHGILSASGALGEFESGLRERLGPSSKVLLESLVDDTRPQFSYAALVSEGGLAGQVAQVLVEGAPSGLASAVAHDEALVALNRKLRRAGLPEVAPVGLIPRAAQAALGALLEGDE